MTSDVGTPMQGKFEIGQPVYCKRTKRFGVIKAGPSLRWSDMGKDPKPSDSYFVGYANGMIRPVTEPDLGPVFASPDQLTPIPVVTPSLWSRFDAWSKEHHITLGLWIAALGLLVAALTLAVAIVALFMPSK